MPELTGATDDRQGRRLGRGRGRGLRLLGDSSSESVTATPSFGPSRSSGRAAPDAVCGIVGSGRISRPADTVQDAGNQRQRLGIVGEAGAQQTE